MATRVTTGDAETVCNDEDVDVPTLGIDYEEYPWAKRVLDKKTRHGTYPNEETRLLLVGATGAGKSESGNTILSVEGVKRAWFEVSNGSKPMTKESKNRKNEILGRMVSVTDTPGTGNKDQQANEICNQIRTAVKHMNGFHAIIYVISIFNHGLRLDQAALTTLKNINEYLGDGFYNYGILLFTYGSEFVKNRKAQAVAGKAQAGEGQAGEAQAEEAQGEDTLRPPGDDLHTYLDEDLSAAHEFRTSEAYAKFHKRAVLFENKEKNPEYKKIMVENLMFLVDEIKADMNNKPFTKDQIKGSWSSILSLKFFAVFILIFAIIIGYMLGLNSFHTKLSYLIY